MVKWVLYLLTGLTLSAQPFNPAFLAGLEARQASTNEPTGGFFPTNLTGCVRWHDATQISATDGDPVSVWPDLTGHADLVADATDHRPLYIAAKTEFGNKPCLHWDGSNDLMTNANLAQQNKTVFIVAYRVGTANASFFSWNGPAAQIYNNSSGPFCYYTQNMCASAGSAQASGCIVVKHATGRTSAIRSQSGAWASFSADIAYEQNAISSMGGADLGGAMNCYVGEIIVLDHPGSDAEVNQVGGYLAEKWNFTWTNL